MGQTMVYVNIMSARPVQMVAQLLPYLKTMSDAG